MKEWLNHTMGAYAECESSIMMIWVEMNGGYNDNVDCVCGNGHACPSGQ